MCARKQECIYGIKWWAKRHLKLLTRVWIHASSFYHQVIVMLLNFLVKRLALLLEVVNLPLLVSDKQEVCLSRLSSSGVCKEVLKAPLSFRGYRVYLSLYIQYFCFGSPLGEEWSSTKQGGCVAWVSSWSRQHYFYPEISGNYGRGIMGMSDGATLVMYPGAAAQGTKITFVAAITMSASDNSAIMSWVWPSYWCIARY